MVKMVPKIPVSQTILCVSEAVLAIFFASPSLLLCANSFIALVPSPKPVIVPIRFNEFVNSEINPYPSVPMKTAMNLVRTIFKIKTITCELPKIQVDFAMS